MIDILLYSAPSLLIGALVILIVSKLINRAKSETIAAINDRLTELNQDTLFELNKRLASPLPKIPNEELLEEAIKLTESRGGISTSILQKAFWIGYSRAARLIDEMEKSNIVEFNSNPHKGLQYQLVDDYQPQGPRFLLGISDSDEEIYTDFSKVGHVMSVGQTGSGHNSYIDGAFVTGLAQAYSPDDLHFVMIDPKRVQLTPYEKLPHLLRPIAYTPEEAKEAVEYLLSETETRFQLLVDTDTKNIREYNRQDDKHMTAIVLVIPEIADLMMVDRDFYETALHALASKSRAVGIHMCLGTQQTKAETFPWELYATISGHLAFRIASDIESELLIGGPEATELEQPGEFIYDETISKFKLKLKAPYVSNDEIATIIEKVSKTS